MDDHHVVRQGLRALLESSGTIEVVGDAANGHGALAVTRATHPEVVVVDLRLGDDDGLTVIRQVRETSPSSRVLVLSAYGGSERLRAAVAAGADSYLLKGVGARELVQGIRRTAAGQQVIDPHFVPELVQRLTEDDESGANELSGREIEILRLLADGMTGRAVAHRLGLSVRTVQKHVQNMHRKLGVTSRAELVREAFRHGLLR